MEMTQATCMTEVGDSLLDHVCPFSSYVYWPDRTETCSMIRRAQESCMLCGLQLVGPYTEQSILLTGLVQRSWPTLTIS